jgi:hypothetical protein
LRESHNVSDGESIQGSLVDHLNIERHIIEVSEDAISADINTDLAYRATRTEPRAFGSSHNHILRVSEDEESYDKNKYNEDIEADFAEASDQSVVYCSDTEEEIKRDLGSDSEGSLIELLAEFGMLESYTELDHGRTGEVLRRHAAPSSVLHIDSDINLECRGHPLINTEDVVVCSKESDRVEAIESDSDDVSLIGLLAEFGLLESNTELDQGHTGEVLSMHATSSSVFDPDSNIHSECHDRPLMGIEDSKESDRVEVLESDSDDDSLVKLLVECGMIESLSEVKDLLKRNK